MKKRDAKSERILRCVLELEQRNNNLHSGTFSSRSSRYYFLFEPIRTIDEQFDLISAHHLSCLPILLWTWCCFVSCRHIESDGRRPAYSFCQHFLCGTVSIVATVNRAELDFAPGEQQYQKAAEQNNRQSKMRRVEVTYDTCERQGQIARVVFVDHVKISALPPPLSLSYRYTIDKGVYCSS